jgi:hypothetical protein
MQQDIRRERIENQRAVSERAIDEQRAEQATPQTLPRSDGHAVAQLRSAQRQRQLQREEDGASEDADNAWISTNA